MATVHEGNKLFDAQSVKGNVDNNNNVIRDTVNTGSQDIRYPVSDSGYIEDGTGENPLRPVIYDGDILYIYTIRGAVTSLVINTDNTYNKEVYPILYKLDGSSILPHVSVTDLNVASGYRMVAINAVKHDDSIELWYVRNNGVSGNCDIYCTKIYPDGTCEREENNIDDGFYKVGEDGYFWKWDNELKQYVSTGKHTSIQYARELLDADDLFFKDSNDQGEEITIEDPSTTGTVLWGAESANKVSLSVNGVSKLLLKSQALDGINSSISTILGYFSSGSARNALLLEGHNSDYFATGAGLDAIDIRVTALENTSFDPTEMWGLLSAATSEQINISHIPDITTSKILNLESWISSKEYITNTADNLINYYLKGDVYNKEEIAELIGSINQFHFEIYPELPTTGQSNVLYLIGPKGDTDVYDEYVYSNNAWTRIGSTSIDLSGYVQNTRTINTGSGLVGGGDLSANRTISLSQETIASLALADTALQQSSLDGYVNDIVTGQGNYISGVSKNGKVLTFTYGTLPTTIALSNVTGAEDLKEIEALSGTGFLKRIGDNSWTLDTNTYALSGDLLAVSGRVTTLESRINWDNYFGIDAKGNIYVRDIDENTPRAFYNNGSITAGGINSSGGGGGGIDLERVWESLINNTDYPNVEINIAHIPTIPYSHISGTPVIPTIIDRARDLLDGNDLSYVNPDEGEEITITDDGRTGTVLWGAESANQVALSVNGTSKTLLKIAALNGINSSITTLLGYFSSGSARNSLMLGGNSPDYYATSSGLNSIDTRVSDLENAAFDSDTMWSLLGEPTDEQINLSHIPDFTVNKVSDIESWIVDKGYLVQADIPTEISAFNNDVGYLTQHQSLANYYTKGEIDSEIGTLRGISITGTGYLTGGGTLAQNRTIDISQQVKTKIDNGSTAYSWGDHSAAGYFLSSNFTKSNIKSTLGISDWALLATKPTYSYTEITGLSTKLSDIEGDITSATGRIQSIEDWFTNPSLDSLTVISPINADITGNSATASRLKGNGAYTAWGRTYWSNGVPKSISGAIENATTINASGAITLSGTNNTARRIYFGDTDHYLELDEYGFHFSHGIYSEDFVTAKGINSTGGGGNVDLDRVWESLTNNTDFPDEKINISHIPTIPWAQLSDTPITIAEYGITDAKINNGVITIGNNSITPLTSHQSLDAYVNAAGYNSTLKQIELKHGSTVVAAVDATAFIKDGMVSNVTISGGYLVISFNTDSGKEDIRIPISDIFDASNYYTKTDADDLFLLKTSFTKANIGLGNVENIAISTWAGSTNITTLGTITTGIWNGSKITNNYLANNTIGVGNATISLGGSASLSQIGVAQWAQTQDSTIDFSALPNLYIGTTRVQDSSATQALSGISTISASGIATITGGISLGGEYNEEDSKLVWDNEHNAWHLIGNFYADGYITAGGLNGSGGGGGGSVDLDRVWESLTNNTDKPNVEINPAHIPDITVSKVSNIESWILGKGYITSSAIPTNVSDFNNDAGYLTDYTIYALTIKNSAGTDVLTYNPKTAAGELSLTKAMIGLGNVENTALSTWVGSQNIATLGTITTGVWHGTKIADEYLALDMSWSLVRASATYDTEDYIHAN